MQKTTIASDIELAEAKAGYDSACKRILSNRVILAWILKYCTEEFAECSIEEIAAKYILKTPEISEIPVHGDRRSTDGRIVGQQNEDTSPEDGQVMFDIRFTVRIPGSRRRAEVIINIEAQRNYYPGYPLPKRGIDYGCRLISSQHGTVSVGEDYGKIQKVYSIWICLAPPKYRQNSITVYEMKQRQMIGNLAERKDGLKG